MRFRHLLPALLLATLSWSHAWASSIFECSTQAENYSGRFVLDENGAFKLIGAKDKKGFECELKLQDYQYQPKAESPNFTLRMSLGKCTRSSGSSYEDRALARRMSLVVTKGKVNDGQADVHWVGYLQPSECRITRYEKESIIRNAQKFEKGLLR